MRFHSVYAMENRWHLNHRNSMEFPWVFAPMKPPWNEVPRCVYHGKSMASEPSKLHGIPMGFCPYDTLMDFPCSPYTMEFPCGFHRVKNLRELYGIYFIKTSWRISIQVHLQAKFHLKVFIVSASGGQKPQFWANFDFLRAPVPTPFDQWEPNLVCYSRPTIYS